MAVDRRIKGNNDSNEYQDALALKKIFEKEFEKKDTKGEVLIICNAILFGQEIKDIDLIVLGNFENYRCNLKTKAETGKFADRIELEQKDRLVIINSFCFVIETKRHRAEDIQLNGIHLLVRYNDKLHDATTQSEQQKYSLTNFFKDRLNYTPYVCNFIWFRNFNRTDYT